MKVFEKQKEQYKYFNKLEEFIKTDRRVPIRQGCANKKCNCT